jgi:hypothetical protein
VPGCYIQGNTKKRELLKCVVAAMYSWQHCKTGTLSYRQPCHLVIINQCNGQQRAVAIHFFNFCWIFKNSRFFVSPCIIYSGISIYRPRNVRFPVFTVCHLWSRIKFHINNVIYFRIHQSPNCRFSAFIAYKSRSQHSISHMNFLAQFV